MSKTKKSPTCNTHMGKKEVYVKTVILIIFFKYYELFIPYLQRRFKSRERDRERGELQRAIMLSNVSRFGSSNPPLVYSEC